jgi:hypothetical protein
MIRALKRLYWGYVTRSLEMTLLTQRRALQSESGKDGMLYLMIQREIEKTRRKLVAARAAYQATLPPGKRMTWREA